MRGVSLKLYSTMRLGGKADFVTEVKTNEELEAAANWAEEKKLPLVMIGEGSNIIWKDEGFKGLIILNRIRGFEKLEEDPASATYKIGAGEDWDSVVERLSSRGLSGVECLSLIPGTAGATPVQNVGAYGQEISQTLQEIHVYDMKTKDFVTLKNNDCNFEYRSSRFKTTDKGRFLICSITLKLSKHTPRPPFYSGLQKYLDEHDIKHYDAPTLRKAVMAIRSAKMPDWHKVANNGSFFANPIVTKKHYEQLAAKHPELVAWEYKDSYKLAAAWLVEQAGFKGFSDTETGMATWPKQALVLVNEHAHSTDDLLSFKKKIVDKVKEMFGITLEQEPELLP